ncbi:restriction endonuclease subunit S [Enterobacter sp. HK169]|uniref:restriction endonuclease subunit S n=1 Tax=Enterobacter sp. HK169 TaxID=1868135 RepID=UPI002F41566F
MDAKQFLAEFGHIANAPGGVIKLRELVLQLAISGRLTERVANDTSAIELIEDNQNCQKILVEQKKLKRRPFPRSVTTNEQPWILPKGWAWTRLGSVTNYGDAPKVELKDVSEDTWVLELEDIEKNTSKLLTKVFARERQFKSIKNGFPKGAVLYGKLRPYLDKVLIADSSGVCTTEINPISFFANIDAGYLRWYLKSPFFISYANESSHGMNLPRLGTDAARDALFAFPPLKEQACIVAKVDELMALCDKLEAQQRTRQKLQNKLRQSMLQAVSSATSPEELQSTWTSLANNFGQLFHKPEDVGQLRDLIRDLAVHGLLVNQSEADEPISNWLAEVTATKEALARQKLIAKQTAMTALSDDEHPFSLPKGWAFVRLGQITNKIGSGSTPRGGREVYVKKGVPFLRSQNVWNDGLHLDDIACITAEEHERMSGTAVLGNDILLNITGASLGRCTLVPSEFGEANVSQHVTIIRLTDPQVCEYLHICILSSYTQSMIWERQVGMAREGLSKKVLEQFEIPLPPIAEQHRIVARVKDLMRFCEVMERQLKRSLQMAEKLAVASVASITGIAIEQEEEPMKAPQTELIAPLRLGTAPNIKAQAPLATILARHHGEMSAKDLWQRFGGEIDAFYAQLKIEVMHGWILEPAPAEVLEKPSDTVSA